MTNIYNDSSCLTKTPKTKKGQETLERIFKAAEEVFEKNGYYNSSISEITKLAGVATGTFYIYFVDKMSLYRFMLESYGKELIASSSEAYVGCKSLHDIQVATLKAYVNFIVKHKIAYKIILEALYINYDYFKFYYTSFSTQIKMNLDKMKDAGFLNDVNTETAAYALMGIYGFVTMKKIIFDEQSEVSNEFLEDVVKLIEKGFFTY